MTKFKGNILFVAPFPIDPFRGGVQRLTDVLAREMRNQGFNTYFISLSDGNETKKPDIRYQFYLPLKQSYCSEENIWFTKEFINEKEITHIINQTGIYADVLNFFKILNLHNIPLYTVHHNCLKCLNERYREIRLSGPGFINNLLRKLDHPFVWYMLKTLNRIKMGKLYKRAVIESDKMVLYTKLYFPELEHYGVKKELFNRVVAIPNPLSYEPKEEYLKNKEKRILFVGRVEINQKRVDRLMEIWPKIFRKHPDWSFDVVGDGPALPYLKQYAQKHKFKNIHFHGTTDPVPFLKKASIFTMTSDFEGWPLVLPEAQAFGVIPVAFDSFASVSEVISEGESGFIVKSFDLDAYADKVGFLINNTEVRERMAIIGQQHVEKFKPANIVEDWIKLFND
jgi:glycosyltransferase involved in cell wall biosynthesis